MKEKLFLRYVRNEKIKQRREQEKIELRSSEMSSERASTKSVVHLVTHKTEYSINLETKWSDSLNEMVK
jgi:hypothetical protein